MCLGVPRGLECRITGVLSSPCNFGADPSWTVTYFQAAWLVSRLQVLDDIFTTAVFHIGERRYSNTMLAFSIRMIVSRDYIKTVIVHFWMKGG